MSPQNIIIIGATSRIAEHCARLWVQKKPMNITLVGRNLRKLEQIAADLKVRSPQSQVDNDQVDFFDPVKIQHWVDEMMIERRVDLVLIAHGTLPEQSLCQTELSKLNEALLINGISPVLFAEAFATHMQKVNHGTLALIGSVAGERGRKSNYIYGSAKGLMARYVEGLQHRFAHTQVNIVLIKPGPTDTPMTRHLKKKNQKLAKVSLVAQHIVDGIAQNKQVIYTPTYWALVMLLIRHLPGFIFNKMEI